MRGVALWILALIASCAPDYRHSAFRCDLDHGCPSDQTCVSGRCRRGTPAHVEVACGEATCDVTQQCCVGVFKEPRCLPAGDACPGTSALCDSVEDCQTGDRCCDDDSTLACHATCDDYACQHDGDCPLTEPNCCHPGSEPWGGCSPFGC